MKNIAFTYGEIKKFSDLLFELTLFNNGKQVYSGNLDLDQFMKITTKYKTIKIIL